MPDVGAEAEQAPELRDEVRVVVREGEVEERGL